MCRSMEEMRNEAAREAAKATLVLNIRTLMETLELSTEQAMDALRVPVEERTEIGKEL